MSLPPAAALLLKEVRSEGSGAAVEKLIAYVAKGSVPVEELLRRTGGADATATATAANAARDATADVCEGALRTRLTGQSLLLARQLCRSDAEFARRVAAHDAELLDAFNAEVETNQRCSHLQPALPDIPACAACGADAGLECPHCAAERRGALSLFVCSQKCLTAAWAAHAAQHAPGAVRPVRRRRRRTALLRTLAGLWLDHLGTVLVLLMMAPFLVYLSSFWTRKYFGWGANLLMSL